MKYPENTRGGIDTGLVCNIVIVVYQSVRLFIKVRKVTHRSEVITDYIISIISFFSLILGPYFGNYCLLYIRITTVRNETAVSSRRIYGWYF
jgi:hypothetical protein